MCCRSNLDGQYEINGAADFGYFRSGWCSITWNLYQPLVDLAGSGATVPLPGFGYALAEGAIKGAEQGLLQAITGGLKAASVGITIAIVWGYLVALIFNPKSIVR